jgi:hypothetical protein
VTTQERPRKRTGRRRTRWPWLALAAACAVLATAVLPGRLFGGGRGERLDRSVFDRQDLIYGAQIGAWDLDGLVTTDPAAGRRVVDAGIRVIRWGVWKRFDVLGQGGDGTMTLAQFDHAVDGIRRLDAIPLIELPPVWDQQCDGAADAWNPAWLEAIVRHAGDRVQLYEFANERDHYCGWDGPGTPPSGSGPSRGSSGWPAPSGSRSTSEGRPPPTPTRTRSGPSSGS